MARGSADRYFQEEIRDSLKLVPEGIEGQVPDRGRSRPSSTSWSAGCARPGLHRQRQHRCHAAGLTFLRVTQAGVREGHVHDVGITREAPNYPRESSLI